jgi:hypothetical protein
MGGIAVGALVATPLISLLTATLASADEGTDATGGGGDITQYTFGHDTLSINDTTHGFDNYFSTPHLDIDISNDGPGSTTLGLPSYEDIVTDPNHFQFFTGDAAGALYHHFTTDPSTFINPDQGLVDIGGGGVSSDLGTLPGGVIGDLPTGALADVGSGALGDVAGGGLGDLFSGLLGGF